MYEYLSGQLIELSAQKAVIDVGGVGYQLTVPLSLSAKVGEPILLYTTLVVREQSHTLFGFVQKSDRELFEQLIALSGIGPKTALGLIGHLGAQGICNAVASGQSALFSKVPGVGKKTAERLLVELKGKVIEGGGSLSEALQALLSLGYPPAKAQKAVAMAEKELGPKADLSAVVTTALRLSKSLT